MKKIAYVIVFAVLFFFIFFLFVGAQQCRAETNPSLKYLGTAFVKIVTSDGKVIYIDPYGVNEPDSADVVLITHEHSDHNELWRVIQKNSCQVIRVSNALQGGVYQSFSIGKVKITAVPAYGPWHPKNDGVGFVLEFDSVKVYHAGGTGNISEMADLASQNITVALLPINLSPEDLTQAAAVIRAKHDIPIHTKDAAFLARFTSPHRLVLFPGQTIYLTNDAASQTAAVLRVPEEYPTIQAAIDAAHNSDTVLVSEGTYYENIRYDGKGIVVTSRYCSTHDWQTVRNTIIDGSKAADKNFGSTVQFLSGEDSTAALNGFTITGGSGTKWVFGTNTPQEGGGVVLCYSSANITNNIITENTIRTAAGTISGGGGGISTLYGNPTICGNVIVSNLSGYAGGVVLNWSRGKIRNNIIYHNTSAGQWGGGGMMVWVSPLNGGIVENNTIVGNESASGGGGIMISVVDAGTVPVIRNNIVWGNRQATGGQVSSPQYLDYNDVEDYSSGTNISFDPQLQDESYMLFPASPCIDAGDPRDMYRDFADPAISGSALFPSKGTLRNDIGAFGGACARILPSIGVDDIRVSGSSAVIECPPGTPAYLSVALVNLGSKCIRIDSVTQTDTLHFSLDKGGRTLGVFRPDSIPVQFMSGSRGRYCDTIKVHRTAVRGTNPLLFVLNAKSNSTPYLNKNIKTQAAIVGKLFEFRIPDSTFVENDQDDTLQYHATDLPAWLSFNAATRTFRGTPTQPAGQLLTIAVSVSDLFQASASANFTLEVKNSTGVKSGMTFPMEFELFQNFPNPFNPATTIRYGLPNRSYVKLVITNTLGQQIVVLENGERDAGYHQVEWQAKFTSGVYFCHIDAVNTTDPNNRFVQVRKMLLLK